MPARYKKYKALIIAVLVTGVLITAIANMSYISQRKSVLEFDRPLSTCALNICSLL